MSSPIKANPSRFFSPSRKRNQGLKGSSIISHETNSSSSEIEKNQNFNKKASICDTVQEQIKKAQMLCSSIKKKKETEPFVKKN